MAGPPATPKFALGVAGQPFARLSGWPFVPHATVNSSRTLGPEQGERHPLDITKRRRHSLQLVHALKHRLSLSEGRYWIGGENEDVRLSTPGVVPINIGGVAQRLDQTILDGNHLVVIGQ